MPSPLPPGVRFWVVPPREHRGRKGRAPRFVLGVGDRRVILRGASGELLMVLLARPGYRWTQRTLAEAVYSWCEDGGSLSAENAVSGMLFKLAERLLRHGIVFAMADTPSTFVLERIAALPETAMRVYVRTDRHREPVRRGRPPRQAKAEETMPDMPMPVHEPEPPPRPVPEPKAATPARVRNAAAEQRRRKPPRDEGRYVGDMLAPHAPWTFPARVEAAIARRAARDRHHRYPTEEATP